MNRLRTTRNIADYGWHVPYPHREAGDGVLMASRILEILEKLTTEPAVLSRVVEGIRTYERDVLREITYRLPP